MHRLLRKVLAVSLLLLPYYQEHLERTEDVCNYLTYTKKESVLVYLIFLKTIY